MMTKLQALDWISNEAPECLYGVLKTLGRGVGDRKYRAARRRSSANHALVLFTVQPRPQTPLRVLLDSLVETRILAVIS